MVKIPTTRGTVARYGWKARGSSKSRRNALSRAVGALGYMRVYKHLIARSVQWRDTDKYISATFRRDAEWLKSTFKEANSHAGIMDPKCKLDPRDIKAGSWKTLPGRLLYHHRVKAGLRKGRQAYTDLVEAAFTVPGRLYDKFAKSGAFTPYKYGLARRGRSKRGTNIFLLRG